LGLEFVTADGTVVDVLSKNKKDNTGIDVKQLLIGSEGVLGLITKAAFQCPTLPKSRHVTLLGLNGFENVIRVWSGARKDLGEILSAFEFFDAECVHNLEKNCGFSIPHFLRNKEFSVLLETYGSDEDHDNEKLMGFLEKNGIEDGAIASSGTQYNFFWQLREDIPEALMRVGGMYAYDISLPRLEDIYVMVTKTREYLKENKFDEKYGLKQTLVLVTWVMEIYIFVSLLRILSSQSSLVSTSRGYGMR